MTFRRYLTDVAPIALSDLPAAFFLLQPGENWNGTAGSGFASTPSDPTRTTAKPAVRLLEPPNQRFTDTLTVGVLAFANNNGTLIGGIDRVRFHFEGNTLDVTEPTLRTLTRYDGSTYLCLGYWAALKKPADTAGDANLYIEAVPSDPTMQSRVIGPYQFSPRDTLWDEELTVTPSQPEVAGSNYQTVSAAIERHRSNTNDATLITITEALEEDLTGISGVDYQGANYCKITASAAVTFSKTSFVSDAANEFRPDMGLLWFEGANITFDMENVLAFRTEDDLTGGFVFRNVQITNSAGRASRWRSGRRPRTYLIRSKGWLLECGISELAFIGAECELVRGNTTSNLLEDFCSDTACAVHNTINSLDATIDWLNDEPALNVTYTGAESPATLALAGSNDASTRTFTAVYGANTKTFIVGSSEARYNTAIAPGYDATTAGEGYFFQDVADWLNSLPGWTATVLDNDRRASSASLAGLKGVGFAAQNVKGTTLQIVGLFDLHGDFFQSFDLGENVIAAFNEGKNMRGQNIFLGSNSTAPNDFYFVANAFSNVITSTGYAQTNSTFSQWIRQPYENVVFAHNTMANQSLNLRFDDSLTTDSYCLVANSAHPQIIINGTSDENLTIADNVIDAGQSAPTGSTGTVAAGDYTTKFVDSVNGDFTPAGELLTNLKPRIVERDIAGALRATSAPAGAVA